MLKKHLNQNNAPITPIKTKKSYKLQTIIVSNNTNYYMHFLLICLQLLLKSTYVQTLINISQYKMLNKNAISQATRKLFYMLYNRTEPARTVKQKKRKQIHTARWRIIKQALVRCIKRQVHSMRKIPNTSITKKYTYKKNTITFYKKAQLFRYKTSRYTSLNNFKLQLRAWYNTNNNSKNNRYSFIRINSLQPIFLELVKLHACNVLKKKHLKKHLRTGIVLKPWHRLKRHIQFYSQAVKVAGTNFSINAYTLNPHKKTNRNVNFSSVLANLQQIKIYLEYEQLPILLAPTKHIVLKKKNQVPYRTPKIKYKYTLLNLLFMNKLNYNLAINSINCTVLPQIASLPISVTKYTNTSNARKLLMINSVQQNNHKWSNFLPNTLYYQTARSQAEYLGPESITTATAIFYNFFILGVLEQLTKKKVWLKVKTKNPLNIFWKNFIYSFCKNNAVNLRRWNKIIDTKQLLEIIIICFKYQDSQILLRFLKHRFEATHFKLHKKILSVFFEILRKNKPLFTLTPIKGIAFDIRGKVGVSGNAKKRHFFFSHGVIGTTTIQLKSNMQQISIWTPTGQMGVTCLVSFK